jgi:hypothetical protein
VTVAPKPTQVILGLKGAPGRPDTAVGPECGADPWVAAGSRAPEGETMRKAQIAAVLAVMAIAAAGPLPSPALGGPSSCRGKKACTADTTAPVVNVAEPLSGATVAGVVRVTGSASDAVGVRRVDVGIDGGAWVVATGTTSWSTSVDTGSLAAGSHTIDARAVDTAGNATTVRVAVNVSSPTAPPAPVADTVAPAVRITSPAAGSQVAGPFTVSGTASDDIGVARVDVRSDGGAWATASGTTSWQRSLDASSWSAGTHVVEARSVDGAGNVSPPVSVSVQVAAPAPPPPSGDPSVAPDTQGTWTSPEGAVIEVATAGPFTIRGVYRLLLENSAAAGDLAVIAPNLTIRVQDTYVDSATTTAVGSPGAYTSVRSTLWLKGIDSTFSLLPDAQFAHEYGHAWTMHHLYLAEGGDWAPYLQARGLAGDNRLDTSYRWSRGEIVAEDYRLLFGSPAAVAQRPAHMNADIAAPADVAGLREFLLGPFRTR